MAGNTPNRWYKQFTHEGGTRAPLIVHWPAGTAGPGELRSQFHHAVDVMPTLLEASGTTLPDELAGHRQRPLDGVSFAYTLRSAKSRPARRLQYFEMLGHRAIWAEGWKAVATHWSARMLQFVPETTHDLHDGDFDADQWELYNLDEDFSECHDRARDEPNKVAELVELWWGEAQRNQVLPLNEQLSPPDKPEGIFELRAEYLYHGTRAASRRRQAPISTTVPTPSLRCSTCHPKGLKASSFPAAAQRVDYVLLVSGRRAHYVTNLLGRTISVARSEQDLPTGRITVSADVAVPVPGRALVTLAVDGVRGPPVELVGANPVSYDVRGRGLQVGSGLPGVWPSYAARSTSTGTSSRSASVATAKNGRTHRHESRVAFIEQ